MKRNRGRPAWLRVAVVVVMASLVVVCGRGSEGTNRVLPSAALPDWTAWDQVLERHVVDGAVDYRGLQADTASLRLFLQSIETHQLGEGALEDRLAFWINAYNASVLRLAVERYPGLGSVKDVPGFFDRLRVPVAGERLTLDEIEGRTLPREEPRVHFALVCAAVSCPPLRAEAYRGDRLDLQLEDQARRFLADPERGARWEAERRTLSLSSLFKWYGGDFTGASDLGAFLWRGRILEYVRPFLPASVATDIGAGNVSVTFLEYDWSLNDRRRETPISGPSSGAVD